MTFERDPDTVWIDKLRMFVDRSVADGLDSEYTRRAVETDDDGEHRIAGVFTHDPDVLNPWETARFQRIRCKCGLAIRRSAMTVHILSKAHIRKIAAIR
jgi:hypothetical protein